MKHEPWRIVIGNGVLVILALLIVVIVVPLLWGGSGS